MENIDLIVLEKLKNKSEEIFEERTLQLEIPQYNNYKEFSEDVRKDIKEPRRVIIIDIWL